MDIQVLTTDSIVPYCSIQVQCYLPVELPFAIFYYILGIKEQSFVFPTSNLATDPDQTTLYVKVSLKLDMYHKNYLRKACVKKT